MSNTQNPSPEAQTNQDTEELKELLTEVGEQAALRSAQKRKAVEEVLLQPDMLNLLEELVGDLSQDTEKTGKSNSDSDSK